MTKPNNIGVRPVVHPTPPMAPSDCRDRDIQRATALDPLAFCSSQLAPSLYVGPEWILDQETRFNINVKARVFFFNKEIWEMTTFADRVMALGLAPDLQYHGGESQKAGSLGIALRYMDLHSNGFWGGFWGAELSLRGGIGHLSLTEGKTHYEGEYKFLSADAALIGSVLILSGYVGLGLRQEFWPQGQDENGQTFKGNVQRLNPTLTVGGGFL